MIGERGISDADGRNSGAAAYLYPALHTIPGRHLARERGDLLTTTEGNFSFGAANGSGMSCSTVSKLWASGR
jgi:hypothetical protein